MSRTIREPASTRAPGRTAIGQTLIGQTLIGRLLAAPVRAGTVVWLGTRAARRTPVVARDAIEIGDDGRIGADHATNAVRAVTLIGESDLAAIASFLGEAGPIAPARLRRNVVVRGLNLHALKEGTFRLGTARLAMTGLCHPCSRMEQEFGPGGYNAVRLHGGITARVLAGGVVRLGDPVIREVDATMPFSARSAGLAQQEDGS